MHDVEPIGRVLPRPVSRRTPYQPPPSSRKPFEPPCDSCSCKKNKKLLEEIMERLETIEKLIRTTIPDPDTTEPDLDSTDSKIQGDEPNGE